MVAKLTLIRGLPGSGKSTLATKLVAPFDQHLEADQFFMHGDDYRYDANLRSFAHDYCRGLTAYWLTRGFDVVVSNTFTQRWELEPYLKLDPKARIIRCTGNYGSIHNVPEDVIENMRQRFEDIEGEEFYDHLVHV